MFDFYDIKKSIYNVWSKKTNLWYSDITISNCSSYTCPPVLVIRDISQHENYVCRITPTEDKIVEFVISKFLLIPNNFVVKRNWFYDIIHLINNITKPGEICDIIKPNLRDYKTNDKKSFLWYLWNNKIILDFLIEQIWIVTFIILNNYFLFDFTAAGVVPCSGRKTSPRTSTIVQFIFYFGPLRSAIIFWEIRNKWLV